MSAFPTSPVDSRSGGVPFVPPLYVWPPVRVVILMVLSKPPGTTLLGPGKLPLLVFPTVFGRTEYDLATSDRPVPIIFSVDLPPSNAGGRKATASNGAYLPPIGAGGSDMNGPVVAGPANSLPRRPDTTQARPPVSSGVVPRVAGPDVHPSSSLTTELKDKTMGDTTVVEKAEKTVPVTDLNPPPRKGPSRPNS